MIGAKVASLGLWGRRVDRAGALATYRVAAVMVALVPRTFPSMFTGRIRRAA